jgi:hypothetical protein
VVGGGVGMRVEAPHFSPMARAVALMVSSGTSGLDLRSQVHATVSWMMRICLQDRADLPGGSCDRMGDDVADRAPSARRQTENFTPRDKRSYRAQVSQCIQSVQLKNR